MSPASVLSRFHVWEYGAPRAVPINPDVVSHSVHGSDLRYFCGILAHVDAALAAHSLRFLLTWNLDAFDEKFKDSVVILVGDENHQTPAWAPDVRAIFKTGGVTADWWRGARNLPFEVAWRMALRDARNGMLAARRQIMTPGAGKPAPMFELPLGYYRLVDVPDVPFASRPIDVFFAGSIGPTSTFSVRPRVVSRRRLVAGLEQARRDLPQLKIEHVGFGRFGSQTAALSPDDYSTQLMRSKIALCPRGNFDETFRLFEAAKSGCVIIAELLPNRWYYTDSPAVQIQRWSHLSSTLRELFANADALAVLARQTRTWWNTRAAERPVAEFICRTLTESLPSG